MRVFKFRTWGKQKGKMVYQNLSELLDGNTSAEVMQYTGIKDKNKKEIYEGDICNVIYYDIKGNPYSKAIRREVKWKGAGFRLCEITQYGELSSSLTTRDIHSIEVIGNIFEGVKE